MTNDAKDRHVPAAAARADAAVIVTHNLKDFPEDAIRPYTKRNRRIHNIVQAIIIVGSIAVTSLTSAGLQNPVFRWSGVVLAALVSVSASFTGYFKFRERGFNQQHTADAIEKEYNAVDFAWETTARARKTRSRSTPQGLKR